MKPISAISANPPVPARDTSVDYLRATLTLLVIAHHSALAYTTFAHFDPDHYLAATAPVVDAARWAPLDYLVSANDSFFMSLMFFVSGLFVWRAIERAGPAAFLRERMLRLGVPFGVGVSTLVPLAYWPSWQMTGSADGFGRYWYLNVTGGWPSGPMWFIWLLLAFNVLAAAAVPAIRQSTLKLRSAKVSPIVVAAIMGLLSGVVYVPMLLRFGFDGWGAFLTPPLWLQVPRVGLYLLWFSAGTWLGRNGLPEFLSPQGDLAQHWRAWVASAVVAFAAFVLVPQVLADNGIVLELRRNAVEGLLWVACCAFSCFAMLAVFRANVRHSYPLADSLARCAYAIYLLHYVAVVWIQFGLTSSALAPALKFAITFTGATCVSWVAAQLLLMLPWLRRIL